LRDSEVATADFSKTIPACHSIGSRRNPDSTPNWNSFGYQRYSKDIVEPGG